MAVNLKDPEMESVVYLLFMEERTQKEAIEFMYGKDYADVNVTPFKNARENLMSENLLSSDGSLRSANFRSETEYFLEQIEKKANQKDKKITSREIEGLRLLLESEWFREFFKLEQLENMQGIARNDNGVLEITNEYNGAFEMVSVVIDDIGIAGKRSYDDLAEYDSFESFIEEQDWKLSLSQEEALKIMTREVEGRVRGNFLEWRKFFLNRVITENSLLENLPKLDFSVYHWNSDLVMAREVLDRELEN